MTVFCGYYNGLENYSGFTSQAFDSVEKAMLFVKAHLDWFRLKSYGFVVYTDKQIKEGHHMIQKRLMTWHRDGTDCGGELINRAIGWRIYIDGSGDIAEEHFQPKGDI